MSVQKEKSEDEATIASTWLIPVEPEVEIEESEKTLEMAQSEDDNVEHHSSDSDEENSYQAVQEFDSVLVDKMCEVCGNVFQTFELVDAELKKRRLLTTCETCSYYITPPVVKIESSDSSYAYSCDKCPKTFTRKDRLDRHKVTHSVLRPYACDLCEKSYKRNDKLTEHIKLTHRNENPEMVTCDICGRTENIITINVSENEAESMKLCESCNLSRQEEMAKLYQDDSKTFQCDLCLRFFSRRDHLTRHRLSHLDLKPFECSICKKCFSRNDRLLRHMKIHPGAKPFSCKVCLKAFADREKLKLHQSTHPKQRGTPLKCELCQKVVRDKDKLKKHLASHDTNKPYICEICGKTFKLQDSLTSHQRIHSELKPFTCETCGMSFKMRESYKRHLLVHSTNTTYSCHICSKIFKRKDKLKTHHLVHIDIKPFTCELCNSAFKRKDKYMRHLRQVHKLPSSEHIKEEENIEKEITCNLCGLTFVCEDDLTEHKMVHYR